MVCEIGINYNLISGSDYDRFGSKTAAQLQRSKVLTKSVPEGLLTAKSSHSKSF